MGEEKNYYINKYNKKNGSGQIIDTYLHNDTMHIRLNSDYNTQFSIFAAHADPSLHFLAWLLYSTPASSPAHNNLHCACTNTSVLL